MSIFLIASVIVHGVGERRINIENIKIRETDE